jgi:hypothetical protein
LLSLKDFREEHRVAHQFPKQIQLVVNGVKLHARFNALFLDALDRMEPAPALPPIPKGCCRFQASDNSIHEIPRKYLAQTRNQTALQTDHTIRSGCFAESEAIARDHSRPLGGKPLVDISTDEMRSPEYIELQRELLALSQNSKEIIAEPV